MRGLRSSLSRTRPHTARARSPFLDKRPPPDSTGRALGRGPAFFAGPPGGEAAETIDHRCHGMSGYDAVDGAPAQSHPASASSSNFDGHAQVAGAWSGAPSPRFQGRSPAARPNRRQISAYSTKQSSFSSGLARMQTV